MNKIINYFFSKPHVKGFQASLNFSPPSLLILSKCIFISKVSRVFLLMRFSYFAMFFHPPCNFGVLYYEDVQQELTFESDHVLNLHNFFQPNLDGSSYLPDVNIYT